MAISFPMSRAGLRAFKHADFKAQRARQRVRLRLLAKMRKRKHILGLNITEKLELDRDLSETERVYVERRPRKAKTGYKKSKTKCGLLDADQIAELNGNSRSGCLIFNAILTQVQYTARQPLPFCLGQLPSLVQDTQTASQLRLYSSLAPTSWETTTRNEASMRACGHQHP